MRIDRKMKFLWQFIAITLLLNGVVVYCSDSLSWYTAYYTNENVVIKPGKDTHNGIGSICSLNSLTYIAWGAYDDRADVNGWNILTLTATADPTISDNVRAYVVGYLEGT
jgi:hypothetical protein